jgi:hypothetical protein
MTENLRVTVTVTITAEIPPEVLQHMFEAIRLATPIDGKFVFEVDGR